MYRQGWLFEILIRIVFRTGLQVLRMTLCASTSFPSAAARVTSEKSPLLPRSLKALSAVSLNLFQLRLILSPAILIEVLLDRLPVCRQNDKDERESFLALVAHLLRDPNPKHRWCCSFVGSYKAPRRNFYASVFLVLGKISKSCVWVWMCMLRAPGGTNYHYCHTNW